MIIYMSYHIQTIRRFEVSQLACSRMCNLNYIYLFWVVWKWSDFCLQSKNSIFVLLVEMLSCLKPQRKDPIIQPPSAPFAEQKQQVPPKAEKKIVQRIYNNENPVIKNEYLDPRDQRIIVPFNKQRCAQITSLDQPIMQEVTEWLMKANYVITSRGFRHLTQGKLTEIQSKTYTSRNMLLNIKQFVGSLTQLKEEYKQELMVRINALETEILGELMLKYPLSSLKGASKRIRSLIRKIDNRANYEYDFLYKNDFTFNYRADGHYSSDVMRALNKMISFANEVYQPAKGSNVEQDSYFQIWTELVQHIVGSDVKGNPKFFQGFDFIYNYASEDDLFSFSDSKQEEAEKMELGREKLEESSRRRLRVNHKIPVQANLFSEEEIESGECKIRNASVLRVIAKWTYELLEKLKQPKEIFLHRAEKFKLTTNKLYSLQNNQKLAIYEAAMQEGERIEQYISQLKSQYILLQTIFAEEKSRHHVGTQDNDLEIYALRVREVYSQCLFKLLCKLIQSLKRVPRTASQLYLEKHQADLPQDELRVNYEILRQVDLVSFKVGDLIRAKYGCSESEFIRIYKNIIEVSEQRPDVLKIVRIKNRLDHKENDIMLNLFFMNKIQCELQLSFERTDQENGKKAKQYSSYNHFLYELRRSLLGPIGEYACILGQYDPVVSQYVILDKNNMLREKNILLQQPQKNGDRATQKRKSEMFLQEKISENTISLPSNPLRQITPRLREIHEILFFCESCCELKKPTNFNLVMQKKRQAEGSQDEENERQQRQSSIRQCKQCFLNKLQLSIQQNKIQYLLKIILGDKLDENELFFRHLIPWDQSAIPIQFRDQELGEYLPRQGFVLSKESRIINFHYFRTFTDEDYTYFVTKAGGQCQIVAKINRILNQDEILSELAAISRRFFIFQFDKNVSIEDGSSFGFGRLGELDAAVCRGECCREPVILGAGVEFKQFNESINKMFIRKILQEFMNVMYLSKRNIQNMINEIVLEDKRYDRGCKNINIIEAEDSHLKDIRFAAKMVNLSDLYIRYNNDLTSLKGIEQCRNLKILYCNECKISSIEELKGLTGLEELAINENRLTSLEGLENCTSLKEFSCFFNQISTLQPIKNCKNLEKLDIGQNHITTLTPLNSLGKLKSLCISKNNIASLEGIQWLSSLEIVDFSHTAINNAALLQKCPRIQRIFCSNTQLTTLEEITSPNLIELDFGQCSKIVQFNLSRTSCNSLQELTADKCINLRRLKNIELCINLRQFYLQDNPNLHPQQFILIGKCPNLQDLNVSGNRSMASLYFLQKLQKLGNLTCSKCQLLNNLHYNSIKKCPNIEVLNVSYNRSLTTTEFLKGCLNINHLNLSGTGVKKFQKTFLKMSEMRYLQLKDMKELEIVNFEFLKDSPQMEKIVIDEIKDIQSLRGVERMVKLKEMLIGRLIRYDDGRIHHLEKELKQMPIKIQRSVRLLYEPF